MRCENCLRPFNIRNLSIETSDEVMWLNCKYCNHNESLWLRQVQKYESVIKNVKNK
jgi:hypothetical protein